MSAFKVYEDLKFSSSDYSVLLLALQEELRIELSFLLSFPTAKGSLFRVDALERLIHIFNTSGEWSDESD